MTEIQIHIHRLFLQSNESSALKMDIRTFSQCDIFNTRTTLSLVPPALEANACYCIVFKIEPLEYKFNYNLIRQDMS